MKLHTLLRHTQESLFEALLAKYTNAYFSDGEYILVPGDIPIMLVAHLDTVHDSPPSQICTTNNGDILMSPQGIGGDDRCGVYALMKLEECSPDHHPWLLFTCDEEVGCLGASGFAVDYESGLLPDGLANLKLIIELDRKGDNDAVYYECANLDLEDYMLLQGWQTEFGSFTDICEIAPVLGVAAVNLSIGYYNQHTIGEYINLDIVTRNISRVKDIILDIDNLPRFDWEEWEYTPKLTDNTLLAGWADYEGWDDEEDYIPEKPLKVIKGGVIK